MIFLNTCVITNNEYWQKMLVWLYRLFLGMKYFLFYKKSERNVIQNSTFLNVENIVLKQERNTRNYVCSLHNTLQAKALLFLPSHSHSNRLLRNFTTKAIYFQEESSSTLHILKLPKLDFQVSNYHYICRETFKNSFISHK